MGDPVTLGLVFGAVGAATSAAGAISAGEAQSSNASYQAQIARNNAQIASQNADYAAKAGAVDVTAQGLKGAAQMGRIKVGQAASGIDVNSGSAVSVREGQSETNKLDALTTQQSALLKVYGYNTTGSNETAQAGLLQNEATQAPIGAALGATGSLLGSASSLGFKWGDAQKSASGG